MRLPFQKKDLTLTPDAADLFSHDPGNLYFPAVFDAATQWEGFAVNSQYGHIYRRQPAVRQVVDYLAGNIAQLPLKMFKRDGEDNRDEDRGHAAAELMRQPNPWTTGSYFIYNAIADYLVYGNWYAWIIKSDSDLWLVSLPPHAVTPDGGKWSASKYKLAMVNGEDKVLDAAEVIHWHNYNPSDPRVGCSKLETLRKVLLESAVMEAQNTEFIKHGQQGGFIQRPLEAPDWGNDKLQRFTEQMRSRTDKPGSIPVLEDGMQFQPAVVPARQAQMLESRELSLRQVTNQYHIPLGMFEPDRGDLDAQRKIMLADVLPPLYGQLQDELNLQLLKNVFSVRGRYFEFDIEGKREGEEDAFQKLVGAVGGPIITVNEARARKNLPPVDGGDEMNKPPNTSGNPKPSPNVMPVPDPNTPAQDGSAREGDPPAAKDADLEVKDADLESKAAKRLEAQARRRDSYAKETEELLVGFFDRQAKVYKSKANGSLESKALDSDRWDKELAEDLFVLAQKHVDKEGAIAAALLDADFDPAQTKNFLKEGARANAGAINLSTKAALEEEGADADAVFEEAKNSRAPSVGTARATFLMSFAHQEAAKQSDPDGQFRKKTWIVTTGSKSRHPHRNGQTAPLFEDFPSGGQYPGDPGLSVDETAHCRCLLSIS